MAGSNTVGMVVTAGVIMREGKVLLCRRPEGKRLAGKWEFPGGKLEPGETPEQALSRELNEELGIRARVGSILDAIRQTDDTGDLLLLFYLCETGDEPIAKEHGEIRFVDPRFAKDLDLAPMDALFCERGSLSRAI